LRLPLIADIKRHSLEDGPGIRSVVFFKGCPLRCGFCHNPEMQRVEAEIVFRPDRCIACGECVRVCAAHAASLTDAGRIDRTCCDGCGKCAVVCPGSALAQVGQPYPVDELVEILLRDEAYYRRSGGGVTFSGGECTLFPEYLVALSTALEPHGIHIVVETAGDFDEAWFVRDLLPLVDLVYFDVKLADADLHRSHCGHDNRRILANLAALLSVAPERVEVRIPLVPGITATDENLVALARQLRGGVPRAYAAADAQPLHDRGRGRRGGGGIRGRGGGWVALLAPWVRDTLATWQGQATRTNASRPGGNTPASSDRPGCASPIASAWTGHGRPGSSPNRFAGRGRICRQPGSSTVIQRRASGPSPRTRRGLATPSRSCRRDSCGCRRRPSCRRPWRG
jgi:pyruvate formate lyase activating enzyme